ncbi:hypothetical protein [Streptomyces sp. 7-21]|nr:hypothetical protein [Streptomyces sp. 7-21]MBL1067432.1 hypothetical protein [Streptomyces sp. 7-21]
MPSFPPVRISSGRPRLRRAARHGRSALAAALAVAAAVTELVASRWL